MYVQVYIYAIVAFTRNGIVMYLSQGMVNGKATFLAQL